MGFSSGSVAVSLRAVVATVVVALAALAVLLLAVGQQAAAPPVPVALGAPYAVPAPPGGVPDCCGRGYP